MMDLTFRMERNRKEAAKFSDLAKTASSEVAPGYGTTGLSGGAGCSVMVDGADNEENQTEVRCRREGEDSA
jgi:hypothetical protein